MRATLAIVAGALLLAIALAISAPASLLDARLSAVSSGRLRIADAEGTLWNGSGELVLLPGGTRRALVWHIEAWPLLRGQVQGTITAEATPAQRADFAYGQQRVELRHFELAAILQICGDAGGAETAATDPCRDACGHGPPLNHPVHVGLRQGKPAFEFKQSAVRGNVANDSDPFRPPTHAPDSNVESGGRTPARGTPTL